ncbi:MAG: hypothetical protein KatS3mg109_1971 [Pirellulaceae bacterium]|nr:MAG: hypothetical protein KatS3mg109_1971 [Pirellulaceae bacterium]
MAMIIVSRHPGAVEWLRRHYPEWRDAAVLSTATGADVAGRWVAGNLPMALAALCERYWAIEFAGTPPRGAEYTADDMEKAGARLVEYRVTRLDS